eukprot:TRINITY_DN11728_c0_g1_i1.p1 TRINITY_DN11728_c0_g1~~TRINITY_DN11728_c0_g1_i1.p1  ORF type:complete len:120 (+),score=23.52 TRINITY_DN11728_c0_g1_i1:12-371(+)
MDGDDFSRAPLLTKQDVRYNTFNHVSKDEIKDIHEQMIAVNEITQIVSNLVYQQGEQLNTIQANVSESSQLTEKAVVELKQANESHKKQRSLTGCLVLVVVSVSIAIALVIAIPLIIVK